MMRSILRGQLVSTSKVETNSAVGGNTRRTFLKTSAAAAAGFMIVPRRVLGGPGFTAPSDTVNIAGIGIGGMGGEDVDRMAELGQNIVALCDVDGEYAARTFNKYPKAKRHTDFRKMLESQKDIDAVVIGTPDHLHFPVSMAAIRNGKHVYCEKPLTHTVVEARRLADEARKAGIATQMGNQGHAYEEMRLLKEWIRDGAIGMVTKVEAWTVHPVWPQGMTERPKDEPPVPSDLDWDLWLGPAPVRPFHPSYIHMLWRGWLDFGTGGIGDMGCHTLDPVFYALDLSAPASVEACSSIYVPTVTWDKPKNTESHPQASIIRYHFPSNGSGPAVAVTWYDGGLMPERPEELEEGRAMGNGFGGVIFIGDKGKIMCGSHGADGVRLIPESRMKDYTKPAKTLARSAGHHREWIEACKGGPKPGSNFDYAGRLTECVLLGNAALKAGRKILWDPVRFSITNMPEADAFLKKEYRKGWEV
jgi:predicted dehydrogenase